MLDRRRKKPPVNVPNAETDLSAYPVTSWQSIFDEIFEPCLVFPSGNLYGQSAIKDSAQKLIEMFEKLEFLELSSHEVADVKNFLEFYRTHLSNIEKGPGNPNGFKSRLVKSSEPLHKVFANAGNALMDAIETELTRISNTSRLAESLHEASADEHPYPGHPKFKDSISRTGDISDALQDLMLIAAGKKILPRTKNRNCPLPCGREKDFGTPTIKATPAPAELAS